MLLLTVNTGSSSTRLAAFSLGKSGPKLLTFAHYKKGEDAAELMLSEFLSRARIPDVDAVVHRIVHGGENLREPCVIDRVVEEEIERLSGLAPLHNPVALSWVRACRQVFGSQLQIAVFDTGFFASLPLVAASYALPHSFCKRYGIRRYGFHGIAHQAMWERWREVRPRVERGGRIISLQLGAGCSITAVDRGQPQDTSMGFSPLEGLVMATRSGDLDPSVVTYLEREHHLKPDEIEHILNSRSGLRGVSAHSGDMQALLETKTLDARLAVDLYCYRARKYVGAYLTILGGAEAVIFGGGVGENTPEVRDRILRDMGWLGIQLDAQANASAVGREAQISNDRSETEVWVVPVDEAAIMAREASVVLDKTRGDQRGKRHKSS